MRIVTILLVVCLAGPAAAQTRRPDPVPTNLPGVTEVPLTNRTRDGSILQGGARFYFGDPPRRMKELATQTIVEPRDGPEGEKDYPGQDLCTRSAVLALTAFATKVREMGGDAVINIRSDPGDPNAVNRDAILCEQGRVVLRGVVISTR